MAMSKRKKRLMVFGIPAVVVIAVILASVAGSNGDETTVQVELAITDDLSELVTASGRVQPQTKVDIASEVSAQIIEVSVSEGEQVVHGQRLLLLDTVQLKSDVAQARYSLDEVLARTKAAFAQLKKDRAEYERQVRLHDQKMTSETDFNNATFAFENSKANHDAMQAQGKIGRARLDKALDNLSKTSVTSPMDGIVTYLKAEVGEIAQAQTAYTQGQTLVTISDLSVFEVEVDVDETEIAKVQLGQPTDIRVDAFRDTVFIGSIVEIGNSAVVVGQGSEDYTTNFRVKVRFAMTDLGLRPGMSAAVDITTNKAENALLVPYASIVTRKFDPDSLRADSLARENTSEDTGGVHAADLDDEDQEIVSPSTDNDKTRKTKKIRKSGVFVVNNGIARFVEAATGIADERNIVVLSGVNEGDTIVSGTFKTLRKLSDGDAVKLEEASLEDLDDHDE